MVVTMIQRSKRKMHLTDEHENLERWLISYADLITLLFAFFVIMYAASSVNESKYKALSNSLEHAFNKSMPTNQSENEASIPLKPLEKPLKELVDNLHQSLKPMIDEGVLRVIETHEGIAIEIKDSALFDSGKVSLPHNSVQILAKIAKPLKGLGNLIRVEGFTDNIPIKSNIFPSNWELSAARAGSVVRLFTEQGISADRLVAMGHAENTPVESNSTPEGRARNRRVSITILTHEKKM
jgi:chemotaxis protein MotB